MKTKKLLLGSLGTFAAIAAPVATVISCDPTKGGTVTDTKDTVAPVGSTADKLVKAITTTVTTTGAVAKETFDIPLGNGPLDGATLNSKVSSTLSGKHFGVVLTVGPGSNGPVNGDDVQIAIVVTEESTATKAGKFVIKVTNQSDKSVATSSEIPIPIHTP